MYKEQNRKVQYQPIGIIEYQDAWDYQTTLFNKIITQKLRNRSFPENEQIPTENFLLFCQHPHVYTLGRSGTKENLLLDELDLKKKEAVYFETNRGGDITYHGPGQLVGYPILDLDNFFTDIHKYLRFLEEAIILTLEEYGIKAGRIQGLTGVWVDFEEGKKARKICAMGVKASRWVTMHGFALNINTDLSYFTNIIPCGISDKSVTSMSIELGKEISIKEVEEKVKNNLSRLFGMRIISYNESKL
ncbi:MAG TPA: lipoyl(octanoyl) transferase LipB [Cytophagaceae bacterium]|nr:lipoyl(octanoyl) transferase LipB [Cytophagaceae bacterium]